MTPPRSTWPAIWPNAAEAGRQRTGVNGPLQRYFMPMEMVAKQVVSGGSRASLTAPAGPAGAARMRRRDPAPRITSTARIGPWALEPRRGRGGAGRHGRGRVRKPGLRRQRLRDRQDRINPYEGLDVRGKIIVVAGLPPELAAVQAAGGRAGAAPMRRIRWARPARIIGPRTVRRRNGALAVVGNRQLPAVDRPGQPRGRRPAAALRSTAQLPGGQIPDAQACPARRRLPPDRSDQCHLSGREAHRLPGVLRRRGEREAGLLRA